MTAQDVIAGTVNWSCECADAEAFLAMLPDDSIDLLFTSPPYLEARTYGIDAGRKLEDWVAWMVRIVRLASPKVRGLIAINCEGQTRDYRYLPAPYLLMADLHRLGFNLRRPAFFHRVGIPGSGGPDWLRADVEPIICITRPGKLPWSDNTACGHTPKWGPGGEMSNRVSDGTRTNQWGKTGSMTGTTTTRNKEKPSIGKPRPSHHLSTRHGRNMCNGVPGSTKGQCASQPAIANPGNLISLNVGGAMMGHACAHANEAPFPLGLPAFFVKSFCRPNGIVLDPFCGSGTTLDAAIQNNRKAVGCDVRKSQVTLTQKRLRTVTPCFDFEDTIT